VRHLLKNVGDEVMKVGSYQDDKLDATGSEHLGSRGLDSSFLRESQPHASLNREECLAHYPFVIVRIACRVCARRGSYRLARLAAKFGPEISLRDLTDRFADDCLWRAEACSKRGVSACGVYLPDLEQPRPPDAPPGMVKLRLVKDT
jgi:hypothetical protein